MVAASETSSNRRLSTSRPFAAGEPAKILVTGKQHEGFEDPLRGLRDDLRALGKLDILDDEGIAFQLVKLVHGDHFQVYVGQKVVQESGSALNGAAFEDGCASEAPNQGALAGLLRCGVVEFKSNQAFRR